MEGNAVKLAKTPNFDKLLTDWPWVKGGASGLDVGLPDGQMGNSEVGHLNIGAGRIVYQELTRISKAIEDGDFFENPALVKAMDNCKQHDSALHLLGLLSDGGVHSHNTHLYALLRMAKERGLTKVYVHCFLDGRDTPPTSGLDYVKELEAEIQKIGIGKIATISGRYYAMDRDNRWERVEKAYNALVYGRGETADCPVCAVEASYKAEINDEFVLPTVIIEQNKPTATIQAQDSVIFFNFRPDRARQLTRALCDEAFAGFQREWFPLEYVCFTEYDVTIPNQGCCLRKGIPSLHFRGVCLVEGVEAIAAGRNGKVRSRYVFLQWRRRRAVSRRRSDSGPLTEGCDLRSSAFHERRRRLRQAG